MKSLVLLCLASSITASILPIQIKFGSHRSTVNSVTQCEGHEDDAMVMMGGSMPESMCMPSTTKVDMHSIIKEDLPTDLMMKLDLKKLTPFHMTVPCLNGVGPCGCPLVKNDLDLKGIQMEVADMGPILGEIMEG